MSSIINGVQQTTITCPHCAHHLSVTIDDTNGDQDYFEECPSCCNEIHINLHLDDLHSQLDVNVVSEDEQFY